MTIPLPRRPVGRAALAAQRRAAPDRLLVQPHAGRTALVMLVRKLARAATRLGTAALAGAAIVALAIWWATVLAALFSTQAHAQDAGQLRRQPQQPAAGLVRPVRQPNPVPADPTRPPPGLAWPAPPELPGGPRASRAPGPASAQPASAAPPRLAEAAAPRLQALHLPRGGAAASAIVDGQLLQEGDRLPGWLVQRIDADGVLLQPQRSSGAGTSNAAIMPQPALRLSLLPPLAAASAPPRP
jgi:hypothetical protein